METPISPDADLNGIIEERLRRCLARVIARRDHGA
jgi:hypothetical protein